MCMDNVIQIHFQETSFRKTSEDHSKILFMNLNKGKYVSNSTPEKVFFKDTIFGS